MQINLYNLLLGLQVASDVSSFNPLHFVTYGFDQKKRIIMYKKHVAPQSTR